VFAEALRRPQEIKGSLPRLCKSLHTRSGALAQLTRWRACPADFQSIQTVTY